MFAILDGSRRNRNASLRSFRQPHTTSEFIGLPRPGQLVAYSVNGVRKGPKEKEHLERANFIRTRTLSEDKDIMNTIHYRPGHLTKVDKSLSRFLNYVRTYPRAHPSADFIR